MSIRLETKNSHGIWTVLISVVTAGFVYAGSDLSLDNDDPKQVNLQ